MSTRHECDPETSWYPLKYPRNPLKRLWDLPGPLWNILEISCYSLKHLWDLLELLWNPLRSVEAFKSHENALGTPETFLRSPGTSLKHLETPLRPLEAPLMPHGTSCYSLKRPGTPKDPLDDLRKPLETPVSVLVSVLLTSIAVLVFIIVCFARLVIVFWVVVGFGMARATFDFVFFLVQARSFMWDLQRVLDDSLGFIQEFLQRLLKRFCLWSFQEHLPQFLQEVLPKFSRDVFRSFFFTSRKEFLGMPAIISGIPSGIPPGLSRGLLREFVSKLLQKLLPTFWQGLLPRVLCEIPPGIPSSFFYDFMKSIQESNKIFFKYSSKNFFGILRGAPVGIFQELLLGLIPGFLR